MGRRGYGCSHYKTGCTFVIWKDQFGVSLEPEDIASLALKGKTARSFRIEDDGGPRQAAFVLLDREKGEISAEE
ncbi:hypothetical protein CM49_03544 [Paenibacillus sp. P1XP2]|jgi:DNA topoisomerase-3|nr:hypothetical protein CM49_03544 [Paenibacillus sp. P1XP2]